MPQLIAAAAATAWAGTGTTVAITSLSTAAASSFSAAVIYAAVYVAVTAAIVYGTSQLTKPKLGSQAAFQDQGRTVMARDPVASRRKIYGLILTSGMWYQVALSGSNNRDYHFAVIYASHEVEEIGSLYLGDELVPIDGSGDGTGKYATGNLHMGPHTGHPGQGVDSEFASAFPGVWTSAHRGDGIAYDAVRIRATPDVWTAGVPTVKRLIKGAKIYDPRDGSQAVNTPTSWKYSNNAALVIADYLRDTTFGKRVDSSNIDWAAVIESANICDEDILLEDGVTTEKRYTINGTALTDQDSSAVLENMATAMAGTIVGTGGFWTIRAGAWRAPVTTLGDGDLADSFTCQPRMSRLDTYNGVKGMFISPINYWQLGDFPAVKNDTYKAADGDIRLWKDVSFAYTTSSATAQRIAKIDLERGRQQITAGGLYKLSALDVIPGEVVNINRPSLGWVNKPFEVSSWELQTYGPDDAQCLGVRLTLRETAEGVWDWADGEETEDDLAPNTALPSANTVPTPTGLTLLTDSSTNYFQTDGTFVPRLRVTWTAPANIYVLEGGRYNLEYKKSADATWIVWEGAGRGNATMDVITDVQVGVNYDVRLQFINTIGVRGAYQTVTSYPITGDTAAPAATTGVTSTAYAGYIQTVWAASTAPDFSEFAIYRNTSATMTGATKLGETPGTQWNDPNVSAGITYYYYVIALDLSNNASAAAGPGSATGLAGPASPVSPSNATAPNVTTSGTYPIGDGTQLAFLTIQVFALPANATWQNLLYRHAGSTAWLVGGQFNNGGTITVNLDDLSPGTGYDIATQAFNGTAGSAIVVNSGNPFNVLKTAGPAGPTSIVAYSPSSSRPVPPKFWSGFGQMYACSFEFTPSTDKDVAFYEYGVSPFTGTPPSSGWLATQQGPVFYYTLVLTAEYLYIRSVDRTGNRGAWVEPGINFNGYISLPAGTMSQQDAVSAEVTGIKVGSSAPQQNVEVPINTTVTLAGSSPSETYALSLAGLGFTRKPDAGSSGFASSDGNLSWRYDWDHASNSSTQAMIVFRTVDGANILGGVYRVNFRFSQYT